MKGKRLIAALLCLLTIVSVTAQQSQSSGKVTQNAKVGKISVNGLVKDESGQPMEAVVVKLLVQKDSSMVTGGVTGANGRFLLSRINAGNYRIVFSYLGYKTISKLVKFSVQDSSVSLGTVMMEPANIELKEAVVVGKVPDIVTKEDTVEYNAGSFKTQPNAVIEDLLKKLPGVEVDKDGKIKAQGKEVKKILLDGKEFFSDDPKVASKNLPANIIEKLQVIDRKSDEARFSGVDDGEDETIINLTVKKGMKKGWFGHVMGGAGTDKRYEFNGMLNRLVDETQISLLGGTNNTGNMGAGDMGASMFSGSSRRFGGGGGKGTTTSTTTGANFNMCKTDQLRFGGDIRYGYSNNDVWQKSEQQNFLKDSISYDNSEKTYNTKSHNINMNFRLHWEIDTLTVLEFMPTFGYNKSKMYNHSTSATLGGHSGEEESLRDSINSGEMLSSSDGHGYNFSGRLSLSRRFRSKQGRQMTFSFNFSSNRNEEDGMSYSRNLFYLNDSVSVVDQKDDNRNWGGSFGVRVTYVEPIFKNHFLTFAYNYNYNYSNADRMAYNIPADGSGELQLDSLYSNRFRNVFQSHRISVGLRGTYPKFRYNVGFDMNPSSSESENLMDHARDVPGKMVFNYSPLFNAAYRISKQKSLNLEYRGRTRQPSVSQLQPVQNITNPLRISKGNPDLNPSYSNNFRLRYNSFEPEKQRGLMAFVNGSFTLNSIVNQTTYDNNTGVQTTMPVNVNGVWNVNGMVMYNMPFKNKKFRFNTMTNASYNHNIGFVNTGGKESERNISRTVNVYENLGLNYNSDLFDVGITGNYSYALTGNSIQSRERQQTMNFGGGMDVAVYIPGNVTVGTDLRYSGSSGYSAGYDQNQWMWNAQVSWQFLKGKQATLMFKIYDILRQVSNISRTATGNYIQDVEYNTLSSYCMLYFSYRFNTMGKRQQRSGRPDGPPGMMRERGGGRPPVGGMRPF